MEFSTTAGPFRDAISTARHATPANPSIASYAGVQIELKENELSLTGSDGSVTISSSLAVEGPKNALGATLKKDGSALILPKPLSNFLATLNADEVVDVRLTPSGDLEVQPQGGNPYSFRRVVATFPNSPEHKTAPRAVNLERLDQALTAIRASTSKDTPGVQLISSDEGLVLHSTDNYRLSRAFLPEAGFGNFAGVVPLGILERIARTHMNQVTVESKGRTLRFSGPGVVITATLQAGGFPDVAGVLSVTPPLEVLISVPKLRQLLPRLNAVAEQAPLKVRFEENQMTLSVSNADLGAGSESLTLEKDVVAPFEFYVKLPFLMDVCNSHDSEVLSLAYSAPLEPLFARSSDNIDVTSILMPLKP